MTVYGDAANATVRIHCGSSRGSGFYFLRPDVVVTNYHVITAGGNGTPIRGVTEDDAELDLELVSFSPQTKHDFALLQVDGDIPQNQHVLQPKILTSFERGTEVVFSGFPHGIPHLLVQRAAICGRISDRIFYIDGSVNGGNSGGPIIDAEDGCVIGIVTQRRFLGAQDLDQLRQAAEQIRLHCQSMAGIGSAQIMGIDFGRFCQMMAEAMLLIKEVLEANANTGIGIGFSVEFVSERCAQEGISTVDGAT